MCEISRCKQNFLLPHTERSEFSRIIIIRQPTLEPFLQFAVFKFALAFSPVRGCICPLSVWFALFKVTLKFATVRKGEGGHAKDNTVRIFKV